MAEDAVAIRAGTQKRADAWASEKEALLNRIEGLEGEFKRISARRRKALEYIRDQKAKIAGIKFRLQEMENVAQGLEPLLDEGLRLLAELVDRDLFFQKSEREQRLNDLRQALGDYDLSLAEKARRLLEALAVESGYGHMVEVSQEEVEMEGRITRVLLLRLGRLALFALADNGKKAWRWDQEKGDFIHLDGWARELGLMADISRRRRVIDLVEAPLGRRALPGGAAR